MRNRVVVIGHGYTSRLGVIRSIAKIDCEIFVIAMVSHNRLGRVIRYGLGKPIDCYSRYVNRVLYCSVGDENGLIRLLLNKCSCTGQKAVLIPDNDVSVAIIDKHQDCLGHSFVFPTINNVSGQIIHWMNKDVQKKMAERVGLNVAKGCVVTLENQSFSIPNGISFPCFTKSTESISGGKRLFKRCDNLEQLSSFLKKVSREYDTQVLIEDYNQIEKEYAVVGFSDGRQVFIPGIIEFISNSTSHFGVAREGVVSPVEHFEVLIEQFKELIKKIGFIGLFDIDFYLSQGVLYFGEINFRFGGSGFAFTSMGVNLPAIMVKYMVGQSYDDVLPSQIKGKATFINERMCLDDYISGALSEREFQSILKSSAIHFVYDESDPDPQRKFNRYCRVQSVKKKIRSVCKFHK